MVVALANEGLAVIAVEGEQGEDFGQPMAQWRSASEGKDERERALCNALGLAHPVPNNIMYQLVHRAASPVLETRRLRLSIAIMIVHAFRSETQKQDPRFDDHFADYSRFVGPFGATAERGRMIRLGTPGGIALWAGWADAVSAWTLRSPIRPLERTAARTRFPLRRPRSRWVMRHMEAGGRTAPGRGHGRDSRQESNKRLRNVLHLDRGAARDRMPRRCPRRR